MLTYLFFQMLWFIFFSVNLACDDDYEEDRGGVLLWNPELSKDLNGIPFFFELRDSSTILTCAREHFKQGLWTC